MIRLFFLNLLLAVNRLPNRHRNLNSGLGIWNVTILRLVIVLGSLGCERDRSSECHEACYELCWLMHVVFEWPNIYVTFKIDALLGIMLEA